ncbi:hypothetical protein FRC07_001945 [Ceratobasidium sp. 392]|nr:hypothetical protein FRC07_001945 [Ceratobasidium sp. 392]
MGRRAPSVAQASGSTPPDNLLPVALPLNVLPPHTSPAVPPIALPTEEHMQSPLLASLLGQLDVTTDEPED